MTYTSQKWLWITDPWITLDHSGDTTLRLAQAADQLGIPQYWCDVRSLRLEGGQAYLDAQPCLQIGPDRTSESFRFGPREKLRPRNFTQIHYRVDPPVHLAYLHPLQILSLGLQGVRTCEVVNPLNALFSHNEKFEAALLGNLMPPSLVSSQWDLLQSFGKSEGRTVMKPLHEAQSKGIELLDWRTAKSAAQAQTHLLQMTEEFSRPIILQKYLEGIAHGEVRLWFVDGQLLTQMKKLPLAGDFRVNMDQGSALVPCDLSPSVRAALPRISRHLLKHKIRLAALDLIDGYVTDFNLTSPGLIPQIERTLGQDLASAVVQRLVHPLQKTLRPASI